MTNSEEKNALMKEMDAILANTEMTHKALSYVKQLRTQKPKEPQSKEQVLVFSQQLRRDVETACRQLDNNEGQSNLTINEEVKKWLSK